VTRHPELFAALAAPFQNSEVKTRPGPGGRTLYYITARTVFNRLDEAAGPENWRVRHRLEKLADGTDLVITTMDIRVEGEWIAKEDAGGFRTMTDKDRNGKEVEDEENTAKTGFTDGTKRVAVLWGIGLPRRRRGHPPAHRP
jgi:hypothetical protein